MRRYGLMPLFILLLGSLSGCASISQEECVLGNWYQIGLSDGTRGYHNRAASYNSECLQYQVKMDVTAYNRGRNQGLKTYCSYENGVSLGKKNWGYNNVCPSSLASEFLSGYQPYKNLAGAKQELEKFKKDVKFYQSRVNSEYSSEYFKDYNIERLNTAKEGVEEAKAKVAKYQQEIEIHKIQREKSKILKELSRTDISPSRRAILNQQLGSLNTRETMLNTIQSIKQIAEMF
ncbi:DUF2799 domain-containing protein [Vibrio caribbeanicus]|uniref:DUF2799 domain-containing protein n=1 Tax=Vibrio caribbeanicus TaxID=701175 RepID=UPI0030DA1D12